MSSGKNSSAAGKLLLIELGTEELPPKALKVLPTFSATFYQELICEGVGEDNPADMKWYATPRRLGGHGQECAGEATRPGRNDSRPLHCKLPTMNMGRRLVLHRVSPDPVVFHCLH